MKTLKQLSNNAILFLIPLVFISSVHARVVGRVSNPETKKRDYCIAIQTEDLTVQSKKCRPLRVSNGALTDNGSYFSLNTDRPYIIASTVANIQAAINTLEAASGGTVFIMPGTYDLNGTGLVIGADETITLIGSGSGNINDNGTTITDDSGIDLLTIGEVGNRTGGDKVAIKNMTFWGDSSSIPATGSGIKIINHSAGLVLRDLKLLGHFVGVQIESEGTGSGTFEVKLEGVKVKTNTTGVLIQTIAGGTDNFTTDVKITNGYFGDNATSLHIVSGASAGESNGHQIANTYFDAFAGQVIVNLDASDKNVFTGCFFDGAGGGNTIVNIDANSDNNSFIGVLFDGDIVDTGTGNFYIRPDGQIDALNESLSLQPRASGNVDIGVITNVADDASGIILEIHRKAAEGNNKINIRTDANRNSWVQSDTTGLFLIESAGTLVLNNGADGNLEIFRQSASGENRLVKQSGYITAASTDKFISWQVDDATDNFILAREDSNILAFDIQMPLITDGRIVKTDRITSNTTLDANHHNIFADTDGGAFTATLPAGVDGNYYRVINVGSSGNNLTIAPNGSELLLGDNSNLTLTDGNVLIIVYETTEGWF